MRRLVGLPLSSVWTEGGGIQSLETETCFRFQCVTFGNGNVFPGNWFPFPGTKTGFFLFPMFCAVISLHRNLFHFNHLHTLLLTSLIVLFLPLSISSRDNNMPPKKRKPNNGIDFPSDHVAMVPSNVVLSTLLLILIMTPSLIQM